MIRRCICIVVGGIYDGVALLQNTSFIPTPLHCMSFTTMKSGWGNARNSML